MSALTRADAQSDKAEQTTPTFLCWDKAPSVGSHTALFISTSEALRKGKVNIPPTLGKPRHALGKPAWQWQSWTLKAALQVKSTDLCCSAALLGWQCFFNCVFSVNVPKELRVCIKGYCIWVLKHQPSIEQDSSVRMNPCQICAVFSSAQPSKHILHTSHELKIIPMCISLHYNFPHVNVSKVCLSICVSIFYMGRQLAWGSFSKGWEKYSGKQHSLDIVG